MRGSRNIVAMAALPVSVLTVVTIVDVVMDLLTLRRAMKGVLFDHFE